MRAGLRRLESLGDGRGVFLDGQRVKDVTTHPAFAEPIRQVGLMYDQARERWDPAATTYLEAATGQRTSAMWLVPRSSADLALRRPAHRAWCQPSGGVLGRTADPRPPILTGFASHPEGFARGGGPVAEQGRRLHAPA